MTGDWDAYVDRARTVLAEPPSTTRGARTWIVDPFLETLGWDVRGEEVTTDVDVAGTPFEYACWVDSTPAAFVAVEPATAPLSRDRAGELVDRMRSTGVDRGIYTNGREFAFFAGRDDVESTACSLADLPECGATLEAFSAEVARDRLARHSRDLVGRRLAVERGTIVDAIADDLEAVAGSAHRTEFEAAADGFLADLVAAFRSDERGSSSAAPGFSAAPGADADFRERSGGSETEFDGDRSPDGSVATSDTRSDATTGTNSSTTPETVVGEAPSAAVDEPADSGPGDRDAEPTEAAGEAVGGVSTSDGPQDADPATDGDEDATVRGARNDGPAADDGDATTEEPVRSGADREGEFVVRFFDESSSVGAIGHSTSRGALVHAAEYLLERGLSGVELPWAAEDGRVVLDDDPVRGDGTGMAEPRELPNGYYLETAGDVGKRARRIEALASRAGLRAMLTGDWETE